MLQNSNPPCSIRTQEAGDGINEREKKERGIFLYLHLFNFSVLIDYTFRRSKLAVYNV